MSQLKIPFFRLGSWKHPQYGMLQITQEFMTRLLANFRSGLPGSPPYVRLGHDKDAADAKATFGDTPSLAWVKDLVQEGPVLYALADPTDPKVVEWVRSKRYRFASAEYTPDHVSKETGQPVGPVLTAIGLTNEPFLTRLPEAVALSAPPDVFYLDCEEVKKPMGMKLADFVKKLGAVFGVDVEDAPAGADPVITPTSTPAPGAAPTVTLATLPAEVQAKLAEIDALKATLATQQEEQKRLATQAADAQKAQRKAEVDKLAAELVGEGIPPAMIDGIRPLLLADTGATVQTAKVKLADGKEQDVQLTQSDLLIQSLRALPEGQRVKYGQAGGQDDGNTAAKLAATIKEDILALGGTIREDGKFVL